MGNESRSECNHNIKCSESMASLQTVFSKHRFLEVLVANAYFSFVVVLGLIPATKFHVLLYLAYQVES